MNNKQDINKALAQLKNIAYILDILFKTITDDENANNKEQEIERKEKAYDYLKKYASMTIKNSVETLKNNIT
jgi:hypothetical protein